MVRGLPTVDGTMHRTLVFDLQELWHDHANVAERVTHACSGAGRDLRVRGMAQIGGQVYLYLLPSAGTAPERYVLAPWEDESVDGVTACLSSRWSAGFDLVGAIQLEQGRHLLLLASGDAAGA